MILKSDIDCAALLTFIKHNDKLAFDIETTGLNVRKDVIIGFGISNQTEGFYVAHNFYNGSELVELISAEKCIEILNALKNKKLITFNGSFDMRFTKNYFGVDLIQSIYSDALLAKHTVDEEQPFRLKDIAKKLYGVEAAEEQRLMKESIKANGGSATEYYKADLDIMGKYCIQDCLLTYQVDADYHEQIAKEGLKDFYFKDEVMPLYREVTIPMEEGGVPLDLELLKQAQTDISSDLLKLEDEIQADLEPLKDEFKRWFLWKDFKPARTGLFAQAIADYCVETEGWILPKTGTGKYSLTAANVSKMPDGRFKDFLSGELQLLDEHEIELIQLRMFKATGQRYMFNLSSKHHLKKIFFQKLDETPLSKTDKGNPQINDEFLELMAEKYDWCRKLQDYNKLVKLKGTYIDRFLERQENGVYYPSFFQHRTVSGRYGSDLQQLPRPKEEGQLSPLVLKYVNMVRKFFVAGKGFKFIDSDYESLEPHVFAHVSGDQDLKNIFLKGHDFYSTIAIKTESLQNVSADKQADDYLGKVNATKRQNAKPYALGVPYGMEDFALSKTLGVDQKTASKLIRGYLDGFPQLKKWMQWSNDEIVRKGAIRSEAGRVRHHKQAPAIWAGHRSYILDSLKLWKRFHENPKKYDQMKFLRKKLKNSLDNGKNFQIQSLSASIVNRACIRIMRELKRKGIDGYVCAQIHDQIIVRVPKQHAEQCRKIVQYLMENTYKISIPLKAPAEIGDNFYDAH